MGMACMGLEVEVGMDLVLDLVVVVMVHLLNINIKQIIMGKIVDIIPSKLLGMVLLHGVLINKVTLSFLINWIPKVLE
jgi:hypothetical protein